MWIASIIVTICFLIALVLSLNGWFEQFSSGQLFGMGSVLSAGGYLTLYALSSRFRGFLKARSIRRLTIAQVLRFYGLLAFVKAYQHVLPALFAIPTGLMDVTLAATSFLIASRFVRRDGRARRGFVLWHLCGLGALAISTILAVVTPTHAMTRFPMSLVPVFIGPMVLICHLLALTAVYENREV